jgi:hypothetical protein
MVKLNKTQLSLIEAALKNDIGSKKCWWCELKLD